MFSDGLEDAHVRVFEFASAVDGAVVVLVAVAKGAQRRRCMVPSRMLFLVALRREQFLP